MDLQFPRQLEEASPLFFRLWVAPYLDLASVIGHFAMNCWRSPLMATKRELIDTGTDKRYVRRNKRGTSFIESDDVGRSLAADRRQHAKTKVKSGQGDKGDRPRPKTKRKAASKGRNKAAARKGAARKSARKKGAKRR